METQLESTAAGEGPAGIDVGPVTQWMGDMLPELQPPLSFERIGDGRSNLTYRVTDAAGAAWILRRPPLGKLLRGAHDMGREYRLIAALGPAGVAVPRAYGMCEDTAVTGAPFYVMELIDGVVVTDAETLARIAVTARPAACQSLVDSLARLHSVDVDAAGLTDLSRHDGYAERQLKAWWRQWEASKDRPISAVESVRDILAANLPEQRSVAVVHGDYKLENVVLGAHGNVRAILDWELSTLGDPIADLGTMLTYWVQPGDPVHWSLEGLDTPTRADGFWDRDQVKQAYAEVTGYDISSVDFYEALGCWKLGVVVQGVARRFRDTPANANIPPERLDPVIDGLFERAEMIAEKLG